MKRVWLCAAALSLVAGCATPSENATNAEKARVFRDDMKIWLISGEKIDGFDGSHSCDGGENWGKGEQCALSEATWVKGSDRRQDEDVKALCGLTQGGAEGFGPAAPLFSRYILKPFVQNGLNFINQKLQSQLKKYSAFYAEEVTQFMYDDSESAEEGTSFQWRCVRISRIRTLENGESIGVFDFIAMFQSADEAIGDAPIDQKRFPRTIRKDEFPKMSVRPLRMLVREPVAEKVHKELTVSAALSAETHARDEKGAVASTVEIKKASLFRPGSRLNTFDKDKLCGETDNLATSTCGETKYWLSIDPITKKRTPSSPPVLISFPNGGADGKALTTLTFDFAESSPAPPLLNAYASYFNTLATDDKADAEKELIDLLKPVFGIQAE